MVGYLRTYLYILKNQYFLHICENINLEEKMHLLLASKYCLNFIRCESIGISFIIAFFISKNIN